MSKSSLTAAVIIAVAIVAGVIIFKAQPSKPRLSLENTYKIGAILPLTGDFSAFGQAINQGAMLALDEAKEQGQVISYVPEDDHSNALGSTNAAHKLVNVDKVQGAITATVQEVKPSAPVFEGTKIPLLATWDSNHYIKTAGENIFTIGFSTEDAGEKMATHAFMVLKLKKVAVIPQIDEWSELIASAFENKFKALGGEVVMKEEIQPTQKDYRTLIVKAKSAGAEGVYFPFLPNTISPFLLQAKQLGFKGALMTGDSFSADEVTQAGAASEGVIFTNLYADHAQALAEKYKVKFGKEAGDPVFVSFGYDGMKTLLAAAKIASEKQIPMKEAMKMADLQGTDYRIHFEGKQYSEKYERLYKVVNGKFEEVK